LPNFLSYYTVQSTTLAGGWLTVTFEENDRDAD